MTRTIFTAVFLLSLVVPTHGAEAASGPDWVTVPNTQGWSCIDRASIKRNGAAVYYVDKTCGDVGGFAPMSAENKVDCSQNMTAAVLTSSRSLSFGGKPDPDATWQDARHDLKTLGGIVPAYVCSLGH